MSDPSEWLKVKLDEIEARAKSAEIDAGSPWRTARNYDGASDVVVASSPLPGWVRPIYWLWDSEDEVHGSPAVAAHVAGLHPAMILQLVAGARKLLELHKSRLGTPGKLDCGEDEQSWPCPTVIELAKGWGWTEDTR